MSSDQERKALWLEHRQADVRVGVGAVAVETGVGRRGGGRHGEGWEPQACPSAAFTAPGFSSSPAARPPHFPAHRGPLPEVVRQLQISRWC